MNGKIVYQQLRMMAAMLLVLACFSVTSCRQIERPFVPEPVCPKTVDLNFDQCPCQAQCSDMEKCRLIERLEQHHVQVVRIGEDMRVLIPSDYLFELKSANFNRDYQYILTHIATLIHCYAKVDVKVAGYTDCWCDPDHNQQLSLLQAQTVAKFLWRQGIDTRLLYAQGYGAKHPIASNQNYHSRARNRRIEITFRDIAHPNAIRGEMVRDMNGATCSKQNR